MAIYELKFTGISNDKNRRVILGSYKYNGEVKRIKPTLQKNENIDFDDGQVLFMNSIVNSIQTKKDLIGYMKLSTTKYLFKFKNEIELIYKIFCKIDNRFAINENENLDTNNIEKFILVGDTKSGKSYIISTILSELLETDKQTLVDLLTGTGETTVALYDFYVLKSHENNIKFNYKLVDKKYLESIAEEVCINAYKKLITSVSKKKSIKTCLKKQLDGKKFRFEMIIGKENYYNLDKEIIEEFFLNVNISLDKFLDVNKKKIIDIILDNLKLIKEKLNAYENMDYIDNTTFLEIIEYVSAKSRSSFLEKVEFKIYRTNIKKEFKILDTIGLNHGEGTPGLDNNTIRDLRVSYIVDKYSDHNIIYTINSNNTTDLTIAPIKLFDKMGILGNITFVVTQLGIKNDYEDLESFKSDKMEDTLDDDLCERIYNNLIVGPISLDILNRDFSYNKNICSKKISKNADVISSVVVSVNKLKKWMDEFLDEIHWNRMDSIAFNEMYGIDEYRVGGSLIFSITHKFIIELLKELDDDKLAEILNINDSITDVEFDVMKYEFRKNLLILLKVYFIKSNINKFEKIYKLRWNADYRENYNISMTKERAEKFKQVINNNCTDLDLILDIILLAGKQTI